MKKVKIFTAFERFSFRTFSDSTIPKNIEVEINQRFGHWFGQNPSVNILETEIQSHLQTANTGSMAKSDLERESWMAYLVILVVKYEIN